MYQFAVIGLGRFGANVAKTLYELGNDVLAIDKDESRTHALINSVTHVVQADATEEDTLRTLGLRNFDYVIVAIGYDLQASIFVSLLLKEMGVRYVVAKAANEAHGKVLERIGVDRVIYPEKEMGIRLAHSLVQPNVLDYIELDPSYSVVEMTAAGKLAGKTLKELGLRARYGINVVAIKKEDRVNISPGADDVVEEGDVMVVIGTNADLARLERLR